MSATPTNTRLPNRISNALQDFHGGVRFEFRRLHFNLEEGGTWFKDDQQLFASGVTNTGNREGPIFAQNLFLTNVLQSYGIRSTGSYSKAAFTTNPVSWFDLSAQFLYTQPETDVNYQQNSTGSFISLSQLLFYTGQQALISATAKLPRTSGNIGVEIRPFRRVRILESWLTDRLHTASSSDGRQTLLPATTPQPPETLQSARLVTNYSQEQIDILVDVTRKLTLRGGYRYVWGDANTVILPVTGLTGFEAGKLRRNIGIAGVSFRPGSKLSLNAEFEGASSDATYFRTSLSNYQRVHARGQYQALASLLIAADFSLLANQNPTAGPLYYYLALQTSISVHWTPKLTGFSVDGDYTRSTVKSDILNLVPQTLTPAPSLYRDNAHLVSALLNIPLPESHGVTPKLSAGGALVVSSGSRPTTYFQPLANLSIPVSKHVAWVSQWRYYGYAEPFFAYEDFRTHLVTTGLKFTR